LSAKHEHWIAPGHKKKNILVTATTIVDILALSMLKKPHGPDLSATTNVNIEEEYMVSVEVFF